MDLRDHGNRRVLIVDDQQEIHDDFIEMLKPRFMEAATDELAAAFTRQENTAFLPEFELLHAPSGEEACEVVKAGRESNRPIAVAFVDIRMPPGIDGIETIRRVRTVDRDIEIIIMTAYTDKSLSEITHDMELLHKVLYIRKPFAREEIQQITLSLVGKWNVEQELAEKRRQLTINHQRLEAVLDATGDAMAMYDVTGSLVFANRGYEKVLDLAKSELKKMSPKAFSAQFKKRFREPDLTDVEGRFLFEGKGNVLEKATAGQVPRQRLFYRSTAPVLDNQGGVIGDLYVYRDVSKEIEVERMKAEVLRLRNVLETTYSFAGMVGRQRTHAAGVRAGEAGCRKRYFGAHSRRERYRQGVGRKVLSLQQLEKKGAVSGRQLRRHSRVAHRKRAVWTRAGGISRGRPSKESAYSSEPREERSFWTRSATCTWLCKPSCCVSCRSERSSGSAAPPPSPSTSG